MANNVQIWDGSERRISDRRECAFHEKHETLLKGYAKQLQHIEEKDYVPMATLKWWIGTIVAIFVSLFTVSLYTSQVAISSLHEIKLRQERTITKIEGLKENIDDFKRLNRDAETEMNSVDKRVMELERRAR
jgi:hypothetical protein